VGPPAFFAFRAIIFLSTPLGLLFFHTGLWRRFLPNSHRKQHF